jgi:multidrug resistance protein
MDSPSSASAPSDRRYIVLFLTIFIDLLGFGLVIPILPNYLKDLAGSEVWVGIGIALFSAMQFIASPLLGSLSDRIGRRPVLLITLLANALGYVLLGLSYGQGLGMLFLARAINGFASGNIGVAQAYIIDITPPEKRSGAMGLIGAAFGMGFIFGPSLGGLIMGTLGFPWLGWIAAGLCLVNLLLAQVTLKESIAQKNPTAPIRLIPITDYVGVMRQPVVRSIFLINFLYITAFFLFQVCTTLFWEDHFGLNDDQRGYAFTFLGVCTTVVQVLLIKPLSAALGDRKLLVIGNIGMAVVLVAMGLVPPGLFLALELPLIFLMALMNGPVGPSSISILSTQTDPREQGKMVGLYQSFGSLARVAGPLVGTSLYGVHYLLPFFLASALLLVNAGWAMRMVKGLRTAPLVTTS